MGEELAPCGELACTRNMILVRGRKCQDLFSLLHLEPPLVRNMILVNRLALTCFYVGSQFETKTDQSSYVPKIFYELILINGSFVDSLLGCHWMKLLSTPDTSLERSTHLFLRGFLV